MRVRLDLHVPDLPEAVGGKRVVFEFDGETVGDLLHDLVGRHGPKAREALYDANGVLDPVIQFAVNGKTWVRHDQLDTRLEPDDEVTIMAFLAGG